MLAPLTVGTPDAQARSILNFLEFPMRRTLVTLALLGCLAPHASAQVRPVRGTNTAQSAVSIYNAEATRRVSGAFDLPADSTVTGDVAVLNGPLTVAGRVTGSLVAINADVRLVRGANIGEHVVIVGGTLIRDDEVTVGGEVRTQAELLRYSLDGERLVPEEDRWVDWRPHWDGPGLSDRGESYTDLFFVAASTYNRVEGLPIRVGPRFRRPTNWGRIEVEAFGIVRTARPIEWDRGSLGHAARADLRLGIRNGLVLGARAFDEITPVEEWQLTNAEAGLASFFLHRDFRDYYGRHGWEASLGGRIGEEVSLTFAGGSERWRAVTARDPFTLFRDTDPWRVNPVMDDAKVDLASVRLRIDTRERVRSPLWGGWYVVADVERGSGTITRAPQILQLPGAPSSLTYTRGFVDARRYNRLSPGTELNLRVVSAGWMGGDRLPLQRRLSLGGPGALDGYDFRRSWYADDRFACGGLTDRDGRATECERIAFAQMEIRRSLTFGWYDCDRDCWWRPGGDRTPAMVVFAEAGRGWPLPSSDGAGGSTSGLENSPGFPSTSTFFTTIGAGIDFGSLGIYFAKAPSTAKETSNLIVRLGRRF